MSYITRSRKYSYHTMDSFFGILKASYNSKSKEMGGYFMIGIFKRCVLENAYFMASIRLQIKQKLTTLLTTVEAEQNIAASSIFFLSSKQPHKLFCSFVFSE